MLDNERLLGIVTASDLAESLAEFTPEGLGRTR